MKQSKRDYQAVQRVLSPKPTTAMRLCESPKDYRINDEDLNDYSTIE